jgi:light-regulated signal transduction histidine kinase (bacteriophytochrome)
MNDADYHSLLKRQIKKHLSDSDPNSGAILAFIKSVDEAYKEFDKERDLVKRSMDLSSNELMHKNESLKRQSEKMALLNSELDEFAFAVSHDLREPLRSVVSFAQLLKNSLTNKLLQDENEFLDSVIYNAKKMDTMLMGMTRYADIQINVNMERVSIEEIVNNAIFQLKSRVEKFNAKFFVPTMPFVIGNKNQLTVLFVNLLGNSLNNPSDLPLIIEISCIEKKDLIEFTLKDNGVGIDDSNPNQFLKLFKKSSRTTDGAGIGLSICKKIILNHGGNIKIERNYPSGLCIKFSLYSS